MVNLAECDRYYVKISIVAIQDLKFQRSGWLAVGMSLCCHKSLLAGVAGGIAVPVPTDRWGVIKFGLQSPADLN